MVRRRPQPNRRRGLLRAAGAVIGLTIILLALILVISSLTAPKAKAPTVPLTPTAGTPLATPRTSGTPGAKKTVVPTVGTKKTKTSMRSGAALARRVLAARGNQSLAVASPDGRFLLSFAHRSGPNTRSPLTLTVRSSGAQRTIGYGDALIRPVWSPDSSAFLYARVTPTVHYPGARWSIVQGTLSGTASVLARVRALSVVPLGWSRGAPLYLAATASDTSVYSVAHSRSTFRSILFPQVVTGASLSPTGTSIAFAVPTGCGYCTVNLFDLNTFKTIYGPSGWGTQWNYAWTNDGRYMVTSGRRSLSIVRADDGSTRRIGLPRGLSRVWPHTMRASLGRSVTLIDTVTGARFSSIQ